ncbi:MULTISPECIES: NAD(P)/FAD-dependent oxidoreductase [unclassified Bacillus (in: firmicutes)]|uniref:NAD(P)/FAD-dependent oxidoreductase n=1 Tax=unclassified Bacillus (in: firmicutes) TaxID=185979 RepID=UPI0008EC1528|nr:MULTISPECIES: FAD-dependent oxidoreductase [unclassified Bacillus (in: firmicutes)]SFA69676.1 sarcosine oxidase subunit alpha [Bacillus sp. UNCCL13]SFQ59006.1 sarcosine oxidase subunit alpha [Bacillus sp. cl95]
MKVDVVVVGGGPAGLSAAIEIGTRGGNVVVVDDHPKMGGKLLGQLHQEGNHQNWWKGYEHARYLQEKAKAANVKFLSGKQVWGLETGWKVHVSNLEQNEPGLSIEADCVLLATGAVENPIPIQGWTLPGVLSIGAAQVMTNVYQVLPGKKVVVIGIDMLSLSIARSMKLAGADVEGIYILPNTTFSKYLSPIHQLELLKEMTDYAPSRFLRLGGKLLQSQTGRKMAAIFYPRKGMKMWGIPIHLRKTVTSINGDQEVDHVTVSNIDIDGNPIGDTKNLKVDAVCISGGLSPLYELAATTGCKFVSLKGLSGTVPLHNRKLQTTVPNLFVAGNITGIEGAKVAMTQGTLAGQSICKSLGIGKISNAHIEECISHVEHVRKLSDIQFHPKVDEARKQLNYLWEQWMNTSEKQSSQVVNN